ncbi:hypothetical protein MVEN_00094400 [Mycena venus]|uniref:Uncharacterized protein n=1 Tax=Mycena venus TaxID=2733690 RepID=A0A8H7DGK0_9AGAR|nr:hypothetical protein MVEN_00094400 [Mycena venus]
MVSWSQLSYCHNAECKFRGSCRKFFPAGTVPSDAVEALGLLCVCACLGVQHYESPSTAPAPDPAATGTKANTSTAPLQNPPKSGSFVDAAKARQQRQMGHIKEQSYDPSSKGPSKRTASATAVASGSTKSYPPIKFTFVLVEKPKTVDEGMYRMPDSGRMTSLYRCGHIKTIEFPASSTPKDIKFIVSDKYSTLPAVLEGRASMFNFILLSKKPISRGTRPFLIPHKTAGEFDLQDLEWSIHTHRQERAYKRCIFISLSRWSPDLKLDIDDDSEVEVSDLSDDNPAHPFVFKEPQSEPMEQDVPVTGNTADDWSNEAPAPKVVPSSITDVHRLTLNLSQPKAAEAWWPLIKTDPYIRAFAALPGIVRLVERLESRKQNTVWSPELVFDLAGDELFAELKFILGFGDPEDDDYATRFNDYFRLGPHGLQPFIELLYRLYNATANWPGLSD